MSEKKRPVRYLGIDIGGTKLHAVIADQHGEVFATARKKVGTERSFTAVIDRVVVLAEKACKKAEVPFSKITAVAVGAPSPILPDGTAVNAPNLGWKRVPLAETLAARFSRPCFALNDCDAGTFGEYAYGAASGARTAVGLFMGTGLGGGIVIDGRIINGDSYQAAEIGHMVVSHGGRGCGCGRRGCLEAYASKTAMARRIAEAVQKGRESLLVELSEGEVSQLRSAVLAKAYEQRDGLAVEVLEEAAEYLGVGVGNMITLLGPSVVVLGGGVIEAVGERLLDRICAAARDVAWPPTSYEQTAIRLSTLKDNAVALGAIAYAHAQGK